MKPELLAPVGSPASLRAAVEAGADSVYMGSIWNARVRARNFTKQELASAISYCRKNNVLAYVTLNTLIFEPEMPLVADYIRFVYEHGADALIVQDLGVAKMCREIAPDLPLHASTQLSTHNSKTARHLKKLGFSRLILAREVSLDQAKLIKERSGAEVETFCHGALCYSYSGKCFFSLIQTQRSANRGACSQMCRFPWKLYANNKYVKSGYLTSTKDMNTISRMPEMEKAGIACVKIEGRLKDAAYVRAIVSAYRKAIDSGEQTDLSKLTSRGYTEGYLTGEARKEKLTSPNAPSFSGTLLGKVARADRNGAQITLSSPLAVGDSIRASSSGKIIEVFRLYRKGKEVKTAEDECTLLIKTIRAGDTLYKVPRAQIEDDFLKDYAPNKIKSSRAYAFSSKKLSFPPLPSLSYLYDKKQLQDGTAGAFVVPFESFSQDLSPHASKLVIDTPRVAFDSELPALEKKMHEMSEHRPLAFMVSEPSLMSDYPSILSPYANITNTLSARAWQEFGNVRGAVPSLEIAQAEKENQALGFASYAGYPQELMISENDLFFELGLDAASGKCELEDPRGNRFEIIRTGGRTAIMKEQRKI
ncbi:MAG: U32 family peptidase [Candidatus Micrarchaeota archaeon]|nr:U32 family peptidase [Candidatus Micrarchaeota archaeon]